jgi:hypothetical protein
MSGSEYHQQGQNADVVVGFVGDVDGAQWCLHPWQLLLFVSLATIAFASWYGATVTAFHVAGGIYVKSNSTSNLRC